MANLKSSQKDIRRTATRAEQNSKVVSRLKTLAKKVSVAREGSDAEAAKSAAKDYLSALDKAIKSNVVHPNKASRKKSQFAKLVSA